MGGEVRPSVRQDQERRDHDHCQRRTAKPPYGVPPGAQERERAEPGIQASDLAKRALIDPAEEVLGLRRPPQGDQRAGDEEEDDDGACHLRSESRSEERQQGREDGQGDGQQDDPVEEHHHDGADQDRARGADDEQLPARHVALAPAIPRDRGEDREHRQDELDRPHCQGQGDNRGQAHARSELREAAGPNQQVQGCEGEGQKDDLREEQAGVLEDPGEGADENGPEHRLSRGEELPAQQECGHEKERVEEAVDDRHGGEDAAARERQHRHREMVEEDRRPLPVAEQEREPFEGRVAGQVGERGLRLLHVVRRVIGGISTVRDMPRSTEKERSRHRNGRG